MAETLKKKNSDWSLFSLGFCSFPPNSTYCLRPISVSHLCGGVFPSCLVTVGDLRCTTNSRTVAGGHKEGLQDRGRALARPRSVGWMWKTALLAWPCNDLPRQRQQHLLHRFIRLDPLSTIDRSFTFRVPIPVKMLWERCSCQDSKSKKK